VHQKLKAEISDVDKDDLVFKLKISPLPVDNLDDKSAVGSLSHGFVRTRWILVGDEPTRRFPTPAKFLSHECSPYPELHVRRESEAVVRRTRAVFCHAIRNLHIAVS
jgi:hypothetical protein